MKKIILLAVSVLLITCCGGYERPHLKTMSEIEASKPVSKPKFEADIELASIEKKLVLDVTKSEDIFLTIMYRDPTTITRATTGDNRLIVYKYKDGSSLIFSMKPLGDKQGLVLDYYKVETPF